MFCAFIINPFSNVTKFLRQILCILSMFHFFLVFWSFARKINMSLLVDGITSLNVHFVFIYH